jgi:hypothetical protein
MKKMIPLLPYRHQRHRNVFVDAVVNQQAAPRRLADFQNALDLAGFRRQIQQNHLTHILIVDDTGQFLHAVNIMRTTYLVLRYFQWNRPTPKLTI